MINTLSLLVARRARRRPARDTLQTAQVTIEARSLRRLAGH